MYWTLHAGVLLSTRRPNFERKKITKGRNTRPRGGGDRCRIPSNKEVVDGRCWACKVARSNVSLWCCYKAAMEFSVGSCWQGGVMWSRKGRRFKAATCKVKPPTRWLEPILKLPSQQWERQNLSRQLHAETVVEAKSPDSRPEINSIYPVIYLVLQLFFLNHFCSRSNYNASAIDLVKPPFRRCWILLKDAVLHQCILARL